MSLSIHLLADNAEPARLDRAVLYLKRTNQRTVNIGGGSQIDRAMQLAERARAEVPGIKVFWRHLEDTGIHAELTPEQWYNSRVTPRLDWLQKHKIVLVTDNESSGDNDQIDRYVTWHVDVMKRLHAVNLSAAVCRFATGNINDGYTSGKYVEDDNQYPRLKPIFDAMLPGDYISPNEYSNAPGKSSAGHLERYKRMWDVVSRELPTTIGEAGICVDYVPDKGYRAVPGLSGRAYAEQMIREEVWYRSGAIDRFLYCIGGHGWESFQIGDDVLETLEAYYQTNPIVVMPPTVPPTLPEPTPPPVLVPADPGIPTRKIIRTPGSFVHLRTGASGRIVGTVQNGTELIVYSKDEPSGIDRWYFVELDDGSKGWVSNQSGKVKFEDVPPKPTEPPPPATPDPRLLMADLYDQMAALFFAQHSMLKGEANKLRQAAAQS